MPGTATPRPSGGTIKIVGKAHGALNAIVVPADKPQDWAYKQFVTEDAFFAYVREFNLIMQGELPDE